VGKRSEQRSTISTSIRSVLLGEVLSDQLIRGYCIDLLNWHALPGRPRGVYFSFRRELM